MQSAVHPTVIGPQDGRSVDFGGLGVRFMVPGADTGDRFSIVEHPLEPRALAAPLHRHLHEDEYSFVLEGRMGALLGDDVVHADVGTLVYKPRNQWHTFWNAGDTPARILEIISPAGFDQYFAELAEIFTDTGPAPEKVGPLAERYGLELRFDSIPMLIERFSLRMG